jgi:hypothetical protein
VRREVVVEVLDAAAAVILHGLEQVAAAVVELEGAAVVVLDASELAALVEQPDAVAEAIADLDEGDPLAVVVPGRALEAVDDPVARAQLVALARLRRELLEDAARGLKARAIPDKDVLVESTCPSGHVT